MSTVILYIEDNPDNMTLVRRVIESLGYQFLGASNGLEGLKRAEELKPDLILLDINLPDIDGYEVARRMRSSSSEYLLRVPILAITANAFSGDAQKALAAGCNAYLAKPINIRDLWERVDSLLGVDPL